MSGARPSAGRPVLAFPGVSALGVWPPPGWGTRCPGSPPRPPPLSRAPPEALPRLDGGRGARGGSRGQPGTAATLAQAGPETPGPVRARGGGGDGAGKRVGEGGARVSPSVGAAAGTYREHSPWDGRETEGAQSSPPWSLPPGGSSPIQPSRRPAWKNFIPAPPDAPSTVAVRDAEAT